MKFPFALGVTTFIAEPAKVMVTESGVRVGQPPPVSVIVSPLYALAGATEITGRVIMKLPVAFKCPSFTTTTFAPAEAFGTVNRLEHSQPVLSMSILFVFQGVPRNVMPPIGILPSCVILVTHTITSVPIGPDEGVIVATGPTIAELAADKAPAGVVTNTDLPPQESAVWGTTELMAQLWEP
jgi:hypothetical protein